MYIYFDIFQYIAVNNNNTWIEQIYDKTYIVNQHITCMYSKQMHHGKETWCHVSLWNVKHDDSMLIYTPVASFTKEVNLRLAKCRLVFNGCLVNRGLTSLVKEATGALLLKQINIG